MKPKVLLDSSLLVAGLVEGHPAHRDAAPWLTAASAGRIQASMSTHGLAETWSVLTRLPMGPPIPGEAARRALERLRLHLGVLSLAESEYDTALRRCSERGLRSGAVFDALHLIAAESAQMDALITLNGADFKRLCEPWSPEIIVPPEAGRLGSALNGLESSLAP